MTLQRLAFPAMLTGSAALAFGPWLVRLADVPPFASAFWRLAIAVPALALLAVIARRRSDAPGPAVPARAVLTVVALAGVFFAIDLALWHLGIKRTTLANATLMGNSASFILPVYGFVVARAWPGRAAAALLCASTGIALLLGRSADVSATHLTGDLLCLGAGAFYALYFIAVDRVRAGVAPMTLLAVATAVGAAALLPVVVGGTLVPHDWTPLILLALGSQVIGQGLIIFAAGYLPPLVIGLTLLVQPAISAMIGSLRFGEALAPVDLGGMALVALALVMVRLPGRVARATISRDRVR